MSEEPQSKLVAVGTGLQAAGCLIMSLVGIVGILVVVGFILYAVIAG